MNKRRELTDMKREWETSGRGERAGNRTIHPFLLLETKQKKERKAVGVAGHLMEDEGKEDGEERFKLRR